MMNKTINKKIIEYHKKDTQMYFISKIFEENKNIWMSGQTVNKKYVINHFKLQCEKNNIIFNYENLYKNDEIKIPGDVQRQLRTFYEKHKIHGITQKTLKNRSKLYIYDDKIKKIDKKKPPRSFPKKLRKKNIKCIICNDNKDMCLDHWRPYNIYCYIYENISTIGNCVFLCEHCNLVKKNRSGAHLVRKGICSYDKWLDIESKITKNGFPPIKQELKEQHQIFSKLNLNI